MHSLKETIPVLNQSKLFTTGLSHCYEVVLASENQFIQISSQKGYMSAGLNGPHYAIESPIRNSCHWLVAYLLARQLNFRIDWIDERIAMLAEWLLDGNIHYRLNFFIHRQKSGGDHCNGVIGPAWVLEALHLLETYKIDNRANLFAETIKGQNKFNKRVKAWNRYDKIQRKYSIDYTIDHQAWYASALSEYCISPEIDEFLSCCLNGAFHIRSNGRIIHYLKSNSLKGTLIRQYYKIRESRNSTNIEEVESGYHIFTLFPLARIFLNYLYHGVKPHAFFYSKLFQRALEYCTPLNITKLMNNKFGFAYNAPGFEFPLVYLAFKNRLPISAEEATQILETQISTTYDCEMKMHSKSPSFSSGSILPSISDPLSLNARIYELILFLYKSSCSLAAT